MRALSLLMCVMAAFAGCRCGTRIEPVTLAVLVADSLHFPATYVGQRSALPLLIRNTGGATAELELIVDAPFSVSSASTRHTLSRGEEVTVEVIFAPTAAGIATSAVAGLEITLDGEGLEVPACVRAGVCNETHFDFAAQQCVERAASDGTACSTACVVGECSAGTCLGAITGCETNDVCLIPTCNDETGCGAVPRVCPAPISACQVATCDSATGCGITDVIDGTLCGPDDCLATEVSICLLGQCVARPRPQTARCSNRWVATTVPSRDYGAMAFDPVRGNTVLFGGFGRGDTWTWDGTRWEERLPVMSPPARNRHAMVWDDARKRVLLFGGRTIGSGILGDTWEWDGVTWVQRMPASSPPAGECTNRLAWDPIRKRAVLFLGPGGTWEWDGLNWARIPTPTFPSTEYDLALAWSGTTQRVTLFGGYRSTGPRLNETWEWDGAVWTQRLPPNAPSGRAGPAMAWDGARKRMLLFGGYPSTASNDTWEWDGTTWTERAPVTSPPIRGRWLMAFDSWRNRMVTFGGDDSTLWEWDGTTWLHRPGLVRPSWRTGVALAGDLARQRVVLFGGHYTTELNETWEWNGAVWEQRVPTSSPPPRMDAAMAYDARRSRTVLFGGIAGPDSLDDTWEWDGTNWVQVFPMTVPPTRSRHTMAWDEVRQRVVMYGGGSRYDTWEWDGTNWVDRTPTMPQNGWLSAMGWDAVGQRVIMVNGATWGWDGTDWSMLSAQSASPPVRTLMAMVGDPIRRRTVYLVRGAGFLDPMETHEWDGTVWSRRMPTTVPSTTNGGAAAWDPATRRVLAQLDDVTWHFLP